MVGRGRKAVDPPSVARSLLAIYDTTKPVEEPGVEPVRGRGRGGRPPRARGRKGRGEGERGGATGGTVRTRGRPRSQPTAETDGAVEEEVRLETDGGEEEGQLEIDGHAEEEEVQWETDGGEEEVQQETDGGEKEVQQETDGGEEEVQWETDGGEEVRRETDGDKVYLRGQSTLPNRPIPLAKRVVLEPYGDR